jgi:hypothetical protein
MTNVTGHWENVDGMGYEMISVEQNSSEIQVSYYLDFSKTPQTASVTEPKPSANVMY